MDNQNIINHLGENRADYENSVVPPIYQSSIFCFDSVDDLRQNLKRELEVPFYTRGVNPTVTTLRRKIAALEKTEDALIFGSGSGAIAAAVMNSVQAGDHVVCVQKPYSWTGKLLGNYLSKYKVEVSFIDGKSIDNFENAVQPNTKLFYLETPNSVTFELQDLRAVAELAKKKGIRTICDNSYSSPIYQNPSEYGIDIVCHSASKYIGGHSDVVAGILCASSEVVNSIFANEFMTIGSIISPNDAWLLLRGLRTLPMRIKQSHETTVKVIDWLSSHPKVEKINYPFLKSFPQLELAKKQMRGCGGLFSMEIKANSIEEIETFCNSLNHFLIACSWGGYESLLFPTCALFDSANYNQTALSWKLIRFYIGFEDHQIIIDDFSQAFNKI